MLLVLRQENTGVLFWEMQLWADHTACLH